MDYVKDVVCVCMCVLGREGNVVCEGQVYGQRERVPSKGTGSSFQAAGE